MKLHIIKIATLALALSCVSSRAETQLDSFIAEALAANPEVRAASNRWAAVRANIGTAGALKDPMAGADLERRNTSLRSFNDVEYSIEQEVPWFGKRGLATDAAAGEARAAEMEFRMKALEVGAAVKKFFYDLWQKQEEVSVNLRMLALAERSEATATVRYENGKASQADVLKAGTEKTKLVENEMELARERADIESELARLLGREQGPGVGEISGALVPNFKLDPAAVRELVTSRQPALIGAMEGSVAAAKARLDLAQKSYSPDFLFRVEARQLNGTAGIHEYDTDIYLTLPWFNKRKNDSAVAAAKWTLEQRKDDYEIMRQKNAAEAQKLCIGIHTLQHHFELYRDRLIPQQRAAVEASRASYESGAASLLDVLDAQRVLLEFEMQNAHHAAEAFRLAAELETLTGGELPQLPVEKSK